MCFLSLSWQIIVLLPLRNNVVDILCFKRFSIKIIKTNLFFSAIPLNNNMYCIYKSVKFTWTKGFIHFAWSLLLFFIFSKLEVEMYLLNIHPLNKLYSLLNFPLFQAFEFLTFQSLLQSWRYSHRGCNWMFWRTFSSRYRPDFASRPPS